MNDTRTLDVKKIKPSSVGNVRHDLGDLEDLTRSIKKSGILQPLTVRAMADKNDLESFELVFGHRRLAAARAAKLTEVPVIVRVLKDQEVIELQLVENIQREDIHPLDEAIGYQRLRDDFDRSVEQLINDTGKTKAYIYASLKLVELSQHAQKQFRKGDFDSSVALYVARLTTEAAQKEACTLLAQPDHTGDKPSARAAFKIIDALKVKVELDESWVRIKEDAVKDAETIMSEATAKKVLADGFVLHDSDYHDFEAVDYDHPKSLAIGQIVAKDMPPVIHVQDPDTRKIFRMCTKKEFGVSVKRIYGDKGYFSPGAKMSEADRKANEKAVLDRKFRALVSPLIGEKAQTGTNVNFLRAILSLFVERVGRGTFINALIKPYEGRKEASFQSLIEGLNEKEVKDELLVLAIHSASQMEFGHVCKLLKVSPASMVNIKKQIAEEAKAKKVAAEKRKKAAAAKPPKGKGGKPLARKKAGSKKNKS